MSPREFVIKAVELLNKNKRAGIEIVKMEWDEYTDATLDIWLKFNLCKDINLYDKTTLLPLKDYWFDTTFRATFCEEAGITEDLSDDDRIILMFAYKIWQLRKKYCK